MFPFTIVALCWCKMLAQCSCAGACQILCCSRRRNRRKLEGKRRQGDLATVEGTAAEMAFLACDDQRANGATSPATILSRL